MPAPVERYQSPHEAVRRWIAKIGFVGSDAQERADAHYFPHAEPALLVKWTRNGDATVSVIGPLTKARQKSFSLPVRYARFVLRAGRARAILGVAMDELADRVVPIEDLWPAAALLRERLAEAEPARAVEVMHSAILERVASVSSDHRSKLIDRALHGLDGGDERIAAVARDVGVSDRHLRRVFLEDVGMTPKHYARIARVERALSSRRGASWATVANEAGFHDQAHMTREFRDLLRVTPTALQRR